MEFFNNIQVKDAKCGDGEQNRESKSMQEGNKDKVHANTVLLVQLDVIFARVKVDILLYSDLASAGDFSKASATAVDYPEWKLQIVVNEERNVGHDGSDNHSFNY